MVTVDVLGASHPGTQVDRTTAGHVQHGPQHQPGPGPAPAATTPPGPAFAPVPGVDVGADRPCMADRNPSGGPQPDRPPHPAHDQAVDLAQFGILQGTGEQGAVVGVPEAAAGGVDGQQVLGPRLQLIGHLQLVGHEVPVGVAEVGAVEPDVALLRQPLYPQPRPPTAPPSGRSPDPSPDRLGRYLEAMAVQHRLLAGEIHPFGPRSALRPMARHRHRRPARVVVVKLVERAPPPLGGRRDPPRPAQVHRPKLPPAPPPAPVSAVHQALRGG